MPTGQGGTTVPAVRHACSEVVFNCGGSKKEDIVDRIIERYYGMSSEELPVASLVHIWAPVVITDFGSALYVRKFAPQEANPVEVQDNETTGNFAEQTTSPHVKFCPYTNELTLI